MPAPDPYADEWKQAARRGRQRSYRALAVLGGSFGVALGVLALWVYVFHDRTYVYVQSRGDASVAILERGMLLAGVCFVAVFLGLSRVLGVESEYARGIREIVKRMLGLSDE